MQNEAIKIIKNAYVEKVNINKLDSNNKFIEKINYISNNNDDCERDIILYTENNVFLVSKLKVCVRLWANKNIIAFFDQHENCRNVIDYVNYNIITNSRCVDVNINTLANKAYKQFDKYKRTTPEMYYTLLYFYFVILGNIDNTSFKVKLWLK